MVRVDTHRVVMVLYGLCGSARAGLAFEPHPEAPGAVVAGFAGRNGGAGQVSIPDDPALRATLDWLAREAKAEVYLRAVLAAVRACDGVAGGWAYERVLELLWGPRKHRQSRWRQLPPVRRIVELLCEASWLLDAPVSAPPAPRKGRARDQDRTSRRAGYGGTFARLPAAGRPHHPHRAAQRPSCAACSTPAPTICARSSCSVSPGPVTATLGVPPPAGPTAG